MPDGTADTATTDTTTTTDTTDTTSTDTDETVDWKAEAEKFKALARKHEDRAKANSTAAKELEELKTASMNDQEKAVALARIEARTEALRDVGAKLVDAEVRAAAAGRNVDIDALLEGLDRSRFIDDDGDAKRDEIVAWVDRIAPADETFSVDLGQGARGADQRALNGDPLLRDVKAKLGIR